MVILLLYGSCMGLYVNIEGHKYTAGNSQPLWLNASGRETPATEMCSLCDSPPSNKAVPLGPGA